MELTPAVQQAIAAFVTGEDGPFDGARLRLLSDNVQPGADLPLSSYTTCAHSGYADSAALTFLEPYYDEETEALTISHSPVEFRSNTATPYVPGTARLWALISAATPPVLLAIGRLEEPLEFDRAERSFHVQVEFKVGQMVS